MSNQKWGWGEIIGVFSLVIASFAFLTPEVRKVFGIEKKICDNPEFLKNNNNSQYPVIGIYLEEKRLNKNSDSIKITKFIESESSRISEQLMPGDEILSINDKPAQNHHVLHHTLASKPCEELKLKIKRGNHKPFDVFVLPALRKNSINNSLRKHQWKDAAVETITIISVLSAQEDGYSIQSISCQKLEEIDNLWMKYSEKKFSFQRQKEIYLDTGNNFEEYNHETFLKFLIKIDWLSDSEDKNIIEKKKEQILNGKADSGSLPLPTLAETTSDIETDKKLKDFYSRIKSCEEISQVDNKELIKSHFDSKIKDFRKHIKLIIRSLAQD